MGPGSSRSGTTASASNPNTRSRYLDCLQDFTPARNIPAPALAWPSASGSLSAIMAGSGSNPSPDKDRLSDSRSPSEVIQARPRRHILVVEDNRADLFLIRDALG